MDGTRIFNHVLGRKGGRKLTEYRITPRQIGEIQSATADIIDHSYAATSQYELSKTARKFDAFKQAYPTKGITDEIELGMLFIGHHHLRGNKPTTLRNYANHLDILWKYTGREDHRSDGRWKLLGKGLEKMEAEDDSISRAIPATLAQVKDITLNNKRRRPVATTIVIICWTTASRFGDTIRLTPEDLAFGKEDGKTTLRVTWRMRKDWKSNHLIQEVYINEAWKEPIEWTIKRKRTKKKETMTLGEMDDKAADIIKKPLSKHSFRRGAAQLAAHTTGSIQAVQSLTLHKNLSSLLKY
eukprot:gene25575-11302_t